MFLYFAIRLSFATHLPAVTFSKNNIELVKFFNDVFYQETSTEQIELQCMLSNTTITLTKVFDPITDF